MSTFKIVFVRDRHALNCTHYTQDSKLCRKFLINLLIDSRLSTHCKQLDLVGSKLDSVEAGRIVYRCQELADAITNWTRGEQACDSDDGVLFFSSPPNLGKSAPTRTERIDIMTNWQLIATLATLVIAIYGANWSAQRGLKEQIEALRNEIAAKLDLIRAEFKAEIAEVKAEQRVTNHRLEALESRFRPAAAD
ncbi:MAG: hypothetical protein ACREEM_42130 [Blastocatellia bacterium]